MRRQLAAQLDVLAAGDEHAEAAYVQAQARWWALTPVEVLGLLELDHTGAGTAGVRPVGPQDADCWLLTPDLLTAAPYLHVTGIGPVSVGVPRYADIIDSLAQIGYIPDAGAGGEVVDQVAEVLQVAIANVVPPAARHLAAATLTAALSVQVLVPRAAAYPVVAVEDRREFTAALMAMRQLLATVCEVAGIGPGGLLWPGTEPPRAVMRADNQGRKQR